MKMSANSTAITVPPSPAIRAEELARALAYVRAKDATAAAAAKASNEDDDMDEDDERATADHPQPVPLQRSLESLPHAFTLFSETISKKVSNLLMAKRAKLRVVTKLEQRETIPNSIRFKFELTGSKEVTGNSDFFDLISASGMAIANCQEELKTYMARAARMEIAILDQKYLAVFYQALKGFAQLLLIEKEVGPQTPSEALIRELALSTLDKNEDYFTEDNRFHLNDETLYSDYKEATEDPLPPWIKGRARPAFLDEYAAKIDTIVGLLYDATTKRWLEKVRELQNKEKAALLQATQQAFFKTAATRETAEGLAKERSLDETLMEKVIADKVAIETKSVRASLSQLENMIKRTKISTDPPKNSKGGAKQAHRASSKKTQSNRPPKKPPTKKLPPKTKGADAADVSDNATSNGSNGKKPKQRNKKPPGKPGKRGAHSRA
jgi:hypothetical protein